MTRKPTLAEAMRLIAEADPAERLKVEMHEAVKGEDLLGQRATPAPSFAGQSPRNAALLAAQQRSHDRAQRAETDARARRAESLEQEIRTLQAGQAPLNQHLIRSTVNQG